MPRDISGNYTLPAGNPVVTNTLISSVWGNTTLSDIGSALTNSLDRTGVSAGMTGQFKAAAGAVGAPGISWQLETTSGFYRIGAGDFGFSIAGTKYAEFTSAAFTFSPTLNLTSGGQALTLTGTAAGNAAQEYMAFNDSAAVRQGYFGKASGSNADIFLVSSAGGLQFHTNNVLAVTIATGRNVTIAAPTSGTALTVNQVTGSSEGLLVTSADVTALISLTTTNASGAYIRFINTATNYGYLGSANRVTSGAANDFAITSVGANALNLGTNTTNRLTINSAGNVTINAPSSGDALTVTSGSVANVLLALSGASGTRSLIGMGRTAREVYFGISGSAGGIITGDAAGDFSLSTTTGAINLSTSNGAGIAVKIGSAGNVTIAAPTSGTTVTASGVASGVVHQAIPSATGAGVAFYDSVALTVGLVLTSSGSDFSKIQNDGGNLWSIATNNALATLGTPVFQWTNSGAPSLKGRGPIAAALVDMTPDTGSWTSTLSGPWIAGNNITVLLKWERQGNIVTIWTDATATQTATLTTTLSASGLPASITPTSVRQCIAGGYSDGVVTVNALCHVNVNTNNTLTITGVSTANAANPTSVRDITLSNIPGSGVVGLNPGWSITYSL